MTSELVVSSETPSGSLGPGSTQYLLSLARVALNASVDLPRQLLQHLLACPDYEVRELALERVLERLREEEEARRPDWLDRTTQSNLTSLALRETHPRCLAKVTTHTHTRAQDGHLFTVECRRRGSASGCFIGAFKTVKCARLLKHGWRIETRQSAPGCLASAPASGLWNTDNILHKGPKAIPATLLTQHRVTQIPDGLRQRGTDGCAWPIRGFVHAFRFRAFKCSL